ncbi:TetR/AcrR family transcriptional regulator [Nocardioides montaniterrae]
MRLRDGRHARWDDHREERRRHILDAAISCVEESPLGADLTLADVAARAGLARTVLQRHFGGRDGLLRAVQADILRQAFALISGPLDDVESFGALVDRLVGQTVEWVSEHLHLHNVVEREVGDGGPSELSVITGEYAGFLAELNSAIAAGFGVTLAQRRLDEAQLLFIGIIGQVRATVAHWASQDHATVPAADLCELLSGWIVAQVVNHSASYGITIERGSTLEGLLAGRD